MSQIQSFNNNGVIPPIGGPVMTLTGDTGGAISPALGNINVLGQFENSVAQFAVVQGDAGTNTLGVAAPFDRIQTVGTTPGIFALAQYTLNPSKALVMSANVIGVKSDYTASCGGYVVGVARREAAGNAVFVGEETSLSHDSIGNQPFFGFLIGSDGNTLTLGVIGVAGETWNWTCTYQYTTQQL